MKDIIKNIFPFLVLLCFFHTAFAQQPLFDYSGLRMNQVQMIGSHNSYKPGIEAALWQIIYARDSNAARALQYGHISFTGQLDLGLRSLEIDVVHDPHGGAYKNPSGLQAVNEAGGIPLAYDTAGDLSKPGLKVFHIPDIDFRSHHLLFNDCLNELKQWSTLHPNHFPVIITMNTKDNDEGLLQFTGAALDSIDMEIRAVLNDDQLITPDLIRGNAKTLNEAILNNGWPMLSAARGRFLFVLDETGEKMATYKAGRASLKGRVMFVNEREGSPEAAFMIMNNPLKDGEEIRRLVKRGYFVRTRADANTIEARANDYRMFEAAKKSGAQIITTDYYLPSTLFPSTYKVVFDDGEYVRKK